MRSFVRTADAARFEDELTAVPGGTVTALATPAPAPPERSADALREHERIARRVHSAGASLPARFGMHYPSTDALATAVAARGDALARTLDEIGDRVELAVVLAWREPPVAQRDATTGREYLARGAAREQLARRAESLVARLVDHLGYEQALTRQAIAPRDGVAATVAVLTPRGEEHVVRERAVEFGQLTDDVTVEVYGPMPPYSFVS